ncbi:DUF1783-domain-containing protein [Neoconidiobolus thromboides FSU 785]|nr:DUF1783-domain-containing protein [Neoconidiobolus thromboides FSU 785]
MCFRQLIKYKHINLRFHLLKSSQPTFQYAISSKHAAYSTTVTPSSPLSPLDKQNIAIQRELPQIKNTRNQTIAIILGGIALWATALSLAFNYQKKNTSIVKATLFAVKYNENTKQLLGEDIQFVDYPWISGDINHMKGNVDFSYWVKGSYGKQAKVLFQSKRVKGVWTPSLFQIETEGKVISLLQESDIIEQLASIEK